jgi:hypothetical protein
VAVVNNRKKLCDTSGWANPTGRSLRGRAEDLRQKPTAAATLRGAYDAPSLPLRLAALEKARSTNFTGTEKGNVRDRAAKVGGDKKSVALKSKTPG